ncbi:O-antigen polysaccharide polymerase Wzy [Dietzia maris]
MTSPGQTTDQNQPRSSSNRPSAAAVAQALLAIVGTAAVYAVGSTAEPTVTLFRLAWITNVVFLVHMVIAARHAGAFFRPTVIVSLLLFLFSAGKIILFSFGFDFPLLDVLFREDLEAIILSYKFVTVSYLWFGLGLVVVPRVSGRNFANDEGSVGERDWIAGIRLAGYFCIAAGFPAFAFANIQNAVVVSTEGYSGYYAEGARVESPLLALSYFFLTGVVFLGCSGGPRLRKLSILLFILLAVFRLTVGDRGEGFIYAFTAYFLYALGPESKVAARRVWSAVLIVLTIVLVPVVGAIRQTFGDRSTFSLDTGLFGLPIETLSTVGFTLFPTVKVIELVDAGWPLSGGLSYLSSVVRLMPSFMRPEDLDVLVREDVHGSPASWLQETLGLSYGPGFTPFAEAYLNFGPFGGVILMFVLGLLFGFLFRLPSSPNAQGVVRLAISLASFVLVAFVVRGSVNFMVPYLIRYVALPILLAGIIAATAAALQGRGRS